MYYFFVLFTVVGFVLAFFVISALHGHILKVEKELRDLEFRFFHNLKHGEDIEEYNEKLKDKLRGKGYKV
jgi:hypothetical protein